MFRTTLFLPTVNSFYCTGLILSYASLLGQKVIMSFWLICIFKMVNKMAYLKKKEEKKAPLHI